MKRQQRQTDWQLMHHFYGIDQYIQYLGIELIWSDIVNLLVKPISHLIMNAFILIISNNFFLLSMKTSLTTSQLPPIVRPIANLSAENYSKYAIQIRQDRAYLKPHLQRITYTPFSEKAEKENCHQIMIQSCIQNRRYQEIWDEEKQFKIRKQLGPSEDGSHKIVEPPSYIGKEAPLKHYKQYKKLEKTLLRKDFNSSAVTLPDKIHQLLGESPSVSLLERSEALRVLPLCLGLVKSKGQATILNLTNYNLGDRYIMALAAGLTKTKSVERCLLGANRITDLGLAQLVRAISPQVLVLDLSQNKITQVDKRLFEMIIEPEYKLQQINLANNLLRVASADALFRNARYSKHLKRLNLSKNKLTVACLDALADMVQKSATLEQLYIGTNYLSGKAGEKIFGLLASNKVLRVLDYSLNQLGDSGQLGCAKAIAACFRANRTLQHVDISFNNFGKEETELIAQGLQPNKHIYGFHYRGNYGWVNSKGFLVLEQKQETLLGSIEQQRMNGFDVTVIRQNHTLKSEPLKNVCWVCEGWHEQEFRVTIPGKNEGKMLVYIHFDFQCYEPRLISQNQLHARYITMVPPKKYRYFFSHAKKPFLDNSAQTEELPIAEKHSFEVQQQRFAIKIDKVSFRTSKTKKIANQANEIIVKTLPRFNGLVTRKVKNPWNYSQSVWAKEWKLDDEQLLRKCFQKDWKHSKIMNLIKNQADQDKVRGLLWNNYASIKTIYKQFASWNPFGDVWAVSNQPFTEFCQQARIINKDTPLKITDLTFITTNSMSGSDWKGNVLVPERGLVRFQFMESLVRLAEEKFKKNGVYDNFADSVQTLLRDHLQPLVPQYNAGQWRLEKYFSEYNDALIKKYRLIFTSIYRRNSKLKVKPGQKPFMCLAEFRSIIERAGLNPYFPQRECYVSFNCSMMTQVDEMQSERFIKMTQIEFIEAMARIANSLPKQCCVEPDDVAPLHLRFQWLIQQLKPLCPEDVRSQFLEAGTSIFKSSQEEDE